MTAPDLTQTSGPPGRWFTPPRHIVALVLG